MIKRMKPKPSRLKNRMVLFCLALLAATATAQQPAAPGNKLTILSTTEDYLNSVKNDSMKAMVELKSVIPSIKYDLRYATTNNFTHERVYPADASHTFLRIEPATALVAVARELESKGLRIKAFDVYRPYAATLKFWELIRDEKYVADPAKGSLHNRGLAIDMTLIHRKTGKELEMGTEFDNFTEKAHPDYLDLPREVIANRTMLRQLMEKHGFVQFPTEWWHYSWPDNRNYETLNIENELLFKAVKKSRLSAK